MPGLCFAAGLIVVVVSHAAFPPVNQRLGVMPSDYGLVVGLALITVGIAALWLIKFAALPVTRIVDPGKQQKYQSWGWVKPTIQILLCGVGIAGAALRAFPIRMDGPHENWPILDATTLAWLAPIVIAFVLPNISEIAWAGFSIKIRELREASKSYEDALDNLANVAQNWSTSLAIYACKMSRQPPERLLESKDSIYADYIRDRMGEAYEMLATKPGETVRLGLWLFDPESKEITFARGFRLKPKQEKYNPGEGMIGKSFTENRSFNEADVRNVPSYVSSRGDDEPPYRAVLCQPICWDGKAIGVITVDRSATGFFDYVSLQVTQGLASQCALALKLYESRNDLFIDD
ncbi:MAG TPA: GAF domain-containing protein [Candidatus Tumulicola sp.]